MTKYEKTFRFNALKRFCQRLKVERIIQPHYNASWKTDSIDYSKWLKDTIRNSTQNDEWVSYRESLGKYAAVVNLKGVNVVRIQSYLEDMNFSYLFHQRNDGVCDVFEVCCLDTDKCIDLRDTIAALSTMNKIVGTIDDRTFSQRMSVLKEDWTAMMVKSLPGCIRDKTSW